MRNSVLEESHKKNFVSRDVIQEEKRKKEAEKIARHCDTEYAHMLQSFTLSFMNGSKCIYVTGRSRYGYEKVIDRATLCAIDRIAKSDIRITTDTFIGSHNYETCKICFNKE